MKRSEKLFDVLGIGCTAVDYLCLMDTYPVEDEKLEVDLIEMQGGGNVGTALVAVSRLGGTAAYYGVVGNDENKEKIIEGLKRDGVDTAQVTVKDGNNPRALILINRTKSTRTIVYSKRNVPLFGPGDINRESIRSAKVLLVDFFYVESSLAASEAAKRYGIPVVVDAERFTTLSSAVMRNATHIIASQGFAREFTGCSEHTDTEEVLKKFSLMTENSFICITLGKNGSLSLDRESGTIFSQKAYEVNVVDTTGAGDVFHGAFSFFLSRGYTPGQAVRYASACSALKCREVGGRKGIPTMKELMEFLKESSP